MRRIAIIVLVVLSASRADAKMMVHYDLAGLLRQSDSVVIADRIGPSPIDPDRTRYRVARSLLGAIKVATDVDVFDSLYDKTTPKAVLFLDAKRELVSSGLRAIENGKVFRFEQFENPGGWHAVPQGPDPQDMWRGGPQLDLPGFERALAAALARVTAFEDAKAERDPAKRRAAVLALFAPPGGRPAGPGFYVDRLAEDARQLLAGAGDVEGALQVALRDRSGAWRRRDFAPLPQLLALAADTTRDLDIRVEALVTVQGSFAVVDDAAGLRAIVALVDDPSPRVRTAAIDAGARLTEISSSDAQTTKRIATLRAQLAASLTKRFATEQDPTVLAAIVATFQDTFKRPLPPRKTGPALVARTTAAGQTIDVDIRCIKPTRAKDMKLVATANGVAHSVDAFNIALHCGDGTGVGGGGGTALAPGRYALTVELGTKPAPTTLALGTLVVGADLEFRVVP